MILKTLKNRGGRGDPQKYKKSLTVGKRCDSNISFSMEGKTICLKNLPCPFLKKEDVGKKLGEMIRNCNKEEEKNKENEKTKQYCDECKKTDGGIYYNTDKNEVEYREVSDVEETGKGKGTPGKGKGKGKGPPGKGEGKGKGKGKGKGTGKGGGLINISPKIYTTSEQGELKCVSDPPKFNFPIESLPGYNDIDDYGLKGEDMKKLKWGRLIKQYYQNQKRWDDVSKITKDLLISIENRYSKKIRQYENPIKLEKSKNRQKEVLARIKEINSLLKSTDSDSSKSDLQKEREQLQTELVNLMKEIPELEKENRTLFPQKANFKKDKKEQQVKKTSNIPEEYLEIPSKYKPAAPELMGLPKKIADKCPSGHKTVYLDKNTINDLQTETKSPVEWEGGKDVSVRDNDFNKKSAFNQRELGVWCLPEDYLEEMECSSKVPVLMKQAGIKQKCSFKKRDATKGGKKSKKK